MAECSTLVDLLIARGLHQQGKVAYTFLKNGEVETERLTFAELDLRARGLGALLQHYVEPGERALLLLPQGLDFIAAFFGCLYAGVVAVPCYPLGSSRTLPRVEAILHDSRPRVVLTMAAAQARVQAWLANNLGGSGPACLAVDDLSPGPVEDWHRPDVRGETLAFLQYTSGSTSTPKGVMVSHANLLHNERLIQAAFGTSENSAIVGWLPLFHDMGLIGNVLQPLYLGASCALMSPVAFLQRPRRWLEAITRLRATVSGGPDFAYGLCVRKISLEERAGLDLSNWKVAFNGSEPVRPETLDRFAEAFEPWGFRREAFLPCYGLAEATLFVSGVAPSVSPSSASFEHVAPAWNLAVPGARPDRRLLVGCGCPLPEQRVIIADPTRLTPLGPGEVGEIWVAGPSIACGYWGRPEETLQTFRVFLEEGEGPFLRTGDLGLLAEDELFVTGRLKDLIILRGRNHYPQDIERTVEGSHPALRPGGSGAFSVEDGGEERLVVVQELEPGKLSAIEEISEAVRRSIAEEHEVQLHELVLIRAGTLPKTSSGKVQRFAARNALLSGTLEIVGRSTVNEGPELEMPSPAVESGTASPELEWLREQAALLLRVPLSRIASNRPLTALGLDSLTAVELKHEIEVRRGVCVPFVNLLDGMTLESLAEELRCTEPAAAFVPAAAPLPELPLSYSQRALWLLDRLAPQSAAYHIAAAVRVSSEFDAAALGSALQALVDRHPALRTTFPAVDGEPFQRIEEGIRVDFTAEDASGWDEACFERRLLLEAERRFDLEAGPLLRIRLFTHPSSEPVILLVVHHIVCDYWSLAVMVREVGELYAAAAAGRPSKLPEPAVSFGDYLAWQERLLSGPQGEALWAYWRDRLAGELPDLSLPADRPRPPVQTYRGASQIGRCEPALGDKARELSTVSGATLYVLLLAAFAALLRRWTGQKDLLIGSPASGRSSATFAGLVGYLTNPVVLRCDISGDPSFLELLVRVRSTVLEALAHQELPFALLTERLRPVRDSSRSPFFQTLFAFYKSSTADQQGMDAAALGEPGGRIETGGLSFEMLALRPRAAQFDLTLAGAELGQGLALSLVYNADLFEAATMARQSAHLLALLAGAVARPQSRLSELPLLSPAERHQILWEWGHSTELSMGGPGLAALFEAQVQRAPDREALVWESTSLTYRELNREANRLANQLQGLGVGPEVPVAVCLQRSPEMVTALLAVLKAGGAYVPLEPSLPGERLRFILEETQPPVLLTEESLLGSLPESRAATLCLPAGGGGGSEQNPRREEDPQGLAYVIYTSGSTGVPKGVAIRQEGVLALLAWAARTFSTGEIAGVLASTSIGFDLSVFELFVPLTRGGTVILARNVLELPTLLAAPRVTLINTVPSAMAELLRADHVLPELRTVNLAGEPLPEALVHRIYGSGVARRVLNLYGPSEDTTYSTWESVPSWIEGPPAIGRPLDGTRAYLLDEHFRPVPIGVAGELYLGGSGLARGYLRRPDLTAQSFLPDPLSDEPGARLYRTGDLARRSPDGRLHFLGRMDFQVKVRGFRIEPGEIEAVLGRYPNVRDALVVVREDAGERRLIAYFVPHRPPGPTPNELRTLLRQRLPDYMLPSAFIALEALPLTPNGKIDRRSLPSSEAAAFDRLDRPDAPRSPIEEILAGIWAELLQCEQVGRDENFFDLGGHSLIAFQLASRLRDIWGLELSWVKILEAPTVASLAQELERDLAGVPQQAPPPLRRAEEVEGPAPLSFAQQRLWFLDQLDPGSTAYSLPAAVRLQGDLDLAALTASLNEIVRRHEALRTRFPIVEGRPVQGVSPSAFERLPLADLSGLGRGQAQVEAQRLAREEARRGFDLASGPLFRFALQRLSGAEHQLVLAFHHIVCDGWSLRVFARELAALYRAFCRREPSPLPALQVDYTDYARWQRLWLTSEELEGGLAFWREQLAGAPAGLDLPVDRPHRQARTSRGGVVSLPLADSLMRAVEALSRRSRATFFMTLLASWQALLSRVSSQEDLLVGTPIANREPVETEGMIGVFANTLVLRGNLAGDPGFSEFLTWVRRTALGAYEHRDLPFEQLVEDLRPVRDLGRSPLFQVFFALVDPPWVEVLPGLELTVDELATESAKFDLSLFITRVDGTTVASLEYDHDIFDETTVRRILDHWQSLLGTVLAAPETCISQVPLLTLEQRHQLVYEWNGGPIPSAFAPTIHGLVARQAARNPSAVAVVSAEGAMSFGELATQAAVLAARLRRLGAGPEVPVAVCAGRSPRLVVALLGVLGSGSFYVPLDPAYPPERLRFLLKDSGALLLLTEERWLEKLSGHGARTVLLDGEAEAARSEAEPYAPPLPGSLAYVLYTSGSTGLPKGVAIEHRNAVALLAWARDAFGSERLSGVLAATSICFDLSIFEIFAPLAWGGRVVLADNALTLASLACAGEVRLVNTVPSALETLVRGGGLPPSVSTVNSAGEPLSGPLAVEIKRLPRVRELFNLYGPSETTTYSTCGLVGDDKPTIGRPIAGSRIHILDRLLQLVPIGVPGEIAIGGAGVARGYLNRPDLTAEKFIPDPLNGEPGARLYRTGDLARYLADGRIDFLGRIDHQVKVRGFRIEPGEIEAVLIQHPAVRQAAVVARRDRRSGSELVAYVAADVQQGIAPGELSGFLALKLPEHMVPQVFVALPALPLTPNGKLDRQALPVPELEPRAVEMSDTARTPMEEMLAGMWAEVLGLERVGRHENFFALGGHSLLASLLISRIRERLAVQLPLRSLFEAPTVEELARHVEAGRGHSASSLAPPIQSVRRDPPPPPSLAQERLWFLDRLVPDSAAYNIPAGIRFRGRLAAAALGRALKEVARRHEVLRTTFPAIDGQPLQQIQPEPAARLAWVDLSGLPQWICESEALRLADQEARRPFDLAAGPLLRTSLVRLDREDHLVILNLHHIVADGWSIGLLVREVTALYRHFAEGTALSLPPLKIQYADYAVWQRQWLASRSLDAQLKYWRDRLADASTALDLPTDRPRATQHGQAGAQLSLAISLERTARLQSLAREHGATLFMVLLAGFCGLLHRYTRQEVLLVGSPVANRGRCEIEPLIGLFANTLVMRGEVSSGCSFGRLLTNIRDAALDAYAHQDLPFEQLVQELSPERSLIQNPLFQVMFVLQNTLLPELDLPGLTVVPIELDSGTAKFELTLSLADRGGALAGSLEYNVWLFDRATVVRMAGHLLTLLEGATAAPEIRITDLPLLGEGERGQLLIEWNQTRTDYPLETSTLHGLVEEQVKVSPKAVAVACEGLRLTYEDLNRRANRLAHALRAWGIGPEMLVGICVERSLEMVWGLLGILKAGAAYVPLDPGYPRERLGFMLEDSGVPVLLTHRRLVGQLPGHRIRVVVLDDPEALPEGGEDNPGVPVLPDNLAYAIYTSGSTGRPKAALNTHRGIVNRLLWMQEACGGLTVADRVLQKTPFSFDVSVWEFFWPLLAGARLVMCRPDGHKDSAYLAELIAAQGITTVHFVPSMLQVFLEEPGAGKCGCLRRLIASGEALSYEIQQRVFACLGAELYNLYGPTETAVDVSFWSCRREDPRRIVPIGRPIANSGLYILDPDLRPVPVGFAGELYITGVGLARGYLGRPMLTAEKFVPHPFAAEPGARAYRTGDLARFLPDGAIEFLGRIDHQVKLRGVRIELGEVESALCALPEVKSAVVLLREDARGEQKLVAYLIPATGELPSRDELRARLGERLPQQMVPSAFVKLSFLPLLPNGKLDRKGLPEPEEEALAPTPPGVSANPIQELLAELFAHTLGVAQVGAHEDFFALGGHSLLASRLASQIGITFNTHLPIGVLFQEPTVAALAIHLEAAMRGGERWVPPIQPLPGGAQSPLSFAQQRLWFLDHLEPGSPLYNFPLAVRFMGSLQPAVLERALLEIVRRHETLRTTFPMRDTLPVQVISPEACVSLPLIDLSGLPENEREPLAARLAAQEALHSFDLTRGPLLRASLLRLDEQEHIGLLTLHHIVCDAWSLGVLTRELKELYAAFSAGRPSPLPQLPIQYADFAQWQHARLRGEMLDDHLQYWRQQLAGPFPRLRLPTDRPVGARSSRGAAHPFELPDELVRSLRDLARREGATLFMVLLAALKTLLYRYTGQEDLVVGADIANRIRPETEGLIGFFVNLLPLRSDLSGNPTFRELLHQVRRTSLAAYAHQELPFDKLVEVLRPERSLDQTPLVRAILSFQAMPLSLLGWPDLQVTLYDLESEMSKRDLTLFVREREEALVGVWSYRTDLFHPGTIIQLSGHFEALLRAVAEFPETRLNALEFGLESLRRQRAEEQRRHRQRKLDRLIDNAPQNADNKDVQLC